MGCLRAIVGLLLFAVAALFGLFSIGAFASGDTRVGWLLLVLASLIALYGSKGFRKKVISKASPSARSAGRDTTAFLESISDPNHDDMQLEETIENEADAWDEFADSHRYMIAVFRSKKDIVVDVLEVNFAEYDGRNLILDVNEPRAVKDEHLGKTLEWDRERRIKRDDLLYFEPLSEDFFVQCLDDLNHYRRAVERGMAIAKTLRR